MVWYYRIIWTACLLWDLPLPPVFVAFPAAQVDVRHSSQILFPWGSVHSVAPGMGKLSPSPILVVGHQ